MARGLVGDDGVGEQVADATQRERKWKSKCVGCGKSGRWGGGGERRGVPVARPSSPGQPLQPPASSSPSSSPASPTPPASPSSQPPSSPLHTPSAPPAATPPPAHPAPLALQLQPILPRFLEARNYLNYRGSIWPNFAGQSALLVVRAEKCAARFGQILPGSLRAKFGQIEPRISHGIRRAARFGQILPAGCPAKFGQIEPR